MGGTERQLDPKDGSGIVAGKADVSFVDIDNDIIRDAQSQTGSFPDRLCGKEGFEQVRGDFGGNGRAIVEDFADRMF